MRQIRFNSADEFKAAMRGSAMDTSDSTERERRVEEALGALGKGYPVRCELDGEVCEIIPGETLLNYHTDSNGDKSGVPTDPFIWHAGNESRCICQIYADFKDTYGMDLDDYYQVKGIAAQTMERCGNCALRKETKPTTVPSIASPEPSQHATGGTHFASFATGAATGAIAGGVTTKLFEHKEEQDMCETRTEAVRTGCGCISHEQVDPIRDELLSGMAKATAVLAAVALVGSLVVLASGFIAALAAVCGALYLAWKLRGVALTIALAALYVVTTPFRFFGGMVADGMAELKAEQASVANAVAYTVVQPIMIEEKREPILLTDNFQSESIQFSQRAERVKVNAKL